MRQPGGFSGCRIYPYLAVLETAVHEVIGLRNLDLQNLIVNGR
ncbi:MAG: hypothetical protein ACE5PV_17920 [Candidatus Poribacteria bacterium]